LADILRDNPKQGVPLGLNCYKIRLQISSKGKGKSGSARVITSVLFQEAASYLISIYDKAEIDTITPKRILELLKAEGLQ